MARSVFNSTIDAELSTSSQYTSFFSVGLQALQQIERIIGEGNAAPRGERQKADCDR